MRIRSNEYLRSAPPSATITAAAQTKLYQFVMPAKIQCLKRAFHIQNAVVWFGSALIGSDIVTVAQAMHVLCAISRCRHVTVVAVVVVVTLSIPETV